MTPSTTTPAPTTLITGAARGIGLGFTRHYLEQGHTVVATVRSLDASKHLQPLAQTYNDHLKLLELDVSSDRSVAGLAGTLQERETKLDLVINNAGVSIGKPFNEWTTENFETNFRVNAIGPALVAQCLVPLMADGGKLINVTSGMGSITLNINPSDPLDAYAMSKAALNMLTRRLAEKLRPRGITTVALSPGWVQTEMGGSSAPTTVEDAVQQITATIASLTLEQTGTFVGEDGAEMPW